MPNPYKDIQFSVVDRVARITLARPPLNVFHIEMMREIVDAVSRVNAMPEVCAIVFAASPTTKMFSAGVSIEEHRADTVFQMLSAFHSIFHALNTASKPVVALVQGAALGGGCELVAFADIVVAARSARFGQPEIKLGVFPPLAAVVLPRVIGEKRARQMILTGDLLSAEEALACGLISQVVNDDQLEAKGEELLKSLRGLSAAALEMTRRALTAASGRPFEEALKIAENVYLNQLMARKDPVEGIEAFLAKRLPRWKHK